MRCFFNNSACVSQHLIDRLVLIVLPALVLVRGTEYKAAWGLLYRRYVIGF